MVSDLVTKLAPRKKAMRATVSVDDSLLRRAQEYSGMPERNGAAARGAEGLDRKRCLPQAGGAGGNHARAGVCEAAARG